MSSAQNPWGEYPRRNTANYKQVAMSFCLHGLCIIVALGCTYYALKCKPFQSMPSISAEAAHPIARHNLKDEGLLKHARRIAPIVRIPALPGAKKLAAGQTKQI